MHFIDREKIERSFGYTEFIPILAEKFREGARVPERGHYDMGTNTLLLMPAWNREYCGVKVVSVHPGNRELDLPSIQGMYWFKDAKTGETKALFDGKALTSKRTAATSALASQFLSPKNSKSSIFVDTSSALQESGDLAVPLSEKIIDRKDIQADLRELCLGIHPGKISEEEITCFKSVGYALEDLAIAEFIYKSLII